MKTHSDKGRYLIACAILEAEVFKYSQQLKAMALDCILAYKPLTIYK